MEAPRGKTFDAISRYAEERRIDPSLVNAAHSIHDSYKWRSVVQNLRRETDNATDKQSGGWNELGRQHDGWMETRRRSMALTKIASKYDREYRKTLVDLLQAGGYTEQKAETAVTTALDNIWST
jgi:hypothetical protein